MTYLRTAGIRLLALTAALTLSAHSQAADSASCSVNQQNWPLCGTDSGGWNVENGSYCIARTTTVSTSLRWS